jgi:hypothetical protein
MRLTHSLVLSLLIGSLVVRSAWAQCPGPDPQEASTANQNPVYLQACETLDPSGGCPLANSPSVVWTKAREALLTVDVPAGFTPESVHWRAYETDEYGVHHLLWEHGSQEGPFPTGGTVTFGAPGLPEAHDVSFQASYCSASYCYCWSSHTSATTVGFEQMGPDPPNVPNMTQLVEDTFDRPATTKKCADIGAGQTPGDGLGPASVWVDCLDPASGRDVIIEQYCDDNGQNCVQAAEAAVNATMTWVAEPPPNRHVYTEAYFRVNLAKNTEAFLYNANVNVWQNVVPAPNPSGMDVKTYSVKLVKGARECDEEATLFVLKLPDEYNDHMCDEATGLPVDHPLGDNWAANCGQNTPLDVQMTGYEVSEAVWLRIEARDTTVNGNPAYEVTGTLAWDCGDSEDITMCQNHCAVTRIDTNTDEDFDSFGPWSASFQEKFYFVERFRAGSIVVPPPPP